jgi:hypothetical protein
MNKLFPLLLGPIAGAGVGFFLYREPVYAVCWGFVGVAVTVLLVATLSKN